MKIINGVPDLNQKAIDQITTRLYEVVFKLTDSYPTNVEGIIIQYSKEHVDGIEATLYNDLGEEITRRFNINYLLKKDEKLPKNGRIT